MWKLLLVFGLVVTGCSFDPLGGVLCDSEGSRENGRICKDGVWVTDPTGVDDMNPSDSSGGEDLDMASDSPVDLAEDQSSDLPLADLESDASHDMEDDASNADMGCIPFSAITLCQSEGLNCGTALLTNNCGDEVTVECGTCQAPLQCGVGGVDNVCACEGSSDAQLCATHGAECGTINVLDPACNVMRQVQCGTCTSPESCGGGGTANQCGCLESQTQFCARLGKNCGPVTQIDRCGITRTYDCGSCQGPEFCGADQPNVCGCSEDILCEDASAQCGALAATGCSNFNTADCGTCNGGSCSMNRCICPSGFEFGQGQCNDVNECALGTSTCDTNAICTNTPGSFTCTCKPGYAGDGINCERVFPTLLSQATGTTTGDEVTLGALGANSSNDLYVAVISIDTLTRTVSSVGGLGLTWSALITQCNGANNERLEVWVARGNSAGGSITVKLSGSPFGLAVSAFQYTNVGNIAGQASTSSANGGCILGSPSSSYSYSFTTNHDESLLIAATTSRGSNQAPGAGWTEIEQVGTQSTRHLVMTYENTVGQDVTVSGTFSNSRNWASMAFELVGP